MGILTYSVSQSVGGQHGYSCKIRKTVTGTNRCWEEDTGDTGDMNVGGRLWVSEMIQGGHREEVEGGPA